MRAREGLEVLLSTPAQAGCPYTATTTLRSRLFSDHTPIAVLRQSEAVIVQEFLGMPLRGQLERRIFTDVGGAAGLMPGHAGQYPDGGRPRSDQLAARRVSYREQ